MGEEGGREVTIQKLNPGTPARCSRFMGTQLTRALMAAMCVAVWVALPAAALDAIESELRLALGARIECRAVPAGSLPRAELKARRLVTRDE